MDTITITSTYIAFIFEQLQSQLGGKLQIKEKEYFLELNNTIGTGYIKGMVIEDAISYLEYTVIFKDDMAINFINSDNSTVYFGYCSKGLLKQCFGENGKTRVLEQFQTGIFSNIAGEAMVLNFKKEEEIKLSMISVNSESVLDEALKYQLQNVFTPNDTEHTFAYIGSFNLTIAEKIQHMGLVSQKGVVRNLLIGGMARQIMALEIQQYSEDLLNIDNQTGSLTKSEMEDISEISEFIKNYPEIQYSLNYLSKKSGLSAYKLQEGFKVMHGRTVTDYIRNVRVEAAEKLIRTSDLNISEIVYTVGLTSRSYFSKIFKEKYDCSPKYYQNHQNSVAVTA
tara:strand:+ start:1970 stop:2986 length:1017 start_codon:yes stop_codon:yes gene_type:complete